MKMILRVVLLVVSLSFLFACTGVKHQSEPQNEPIPKPTPKTSMDNDRALYQKWLKEKNLKEMGKKLEKE